MGCRIREQRHICGATEQDAYYQEIDFIPVTDRQHRGSLRSKKRFASTLVQQTLNEENSRRWYAQLAHTNFGLNDYVLHLTFDQAHNPSSEEEAWRYFENYIERANYRRKKQGLPLVKYMAVLELKGKRSIRYHLHVIMDGRLPIPELRDLWSTGRGKNKKRIGSSRIEYLDPQGHGGTILDLCYYVTKDPEGKRRWRQSKGLKQPKRPRPNDSRYSRAKLHDMCKNRLDDHDWWCQQYPGWELVSPAKARYNEHTGWSMYARLRRRDWALVHPPPRKADRS